MFDFGESLKSLLTNPRHTKTSNRMTELETFHFGSMLNSGIELYANGSKPTDVEVVFPCGFIVFTDESHHDTNGGNKCAPVSMTAHMLNMDARSDYDNWVNLAFIPNLHIENGNYANNYDDEWVEMHKKKKGKKRQTMLCVRSLFRINSSFTGRYLRSSRTSVIILVD
mmetsp:Transcript_20919/g.35979  ORF Transcript_20919/g.35979 Transcript_20919/m.35979 type:complete len:168 (-) Transcript_20919:361-864(-)